MPRSTTKPVVSKPSVSVPVNYQHQPSLFSSMKQGFGFGIGSSIAHNIFDSKEAKPMQPMQPMQPLTDKTSEFKLCMEKTYNNYEECSPILK